MQRASNGHKGTARNDDSYSYRDEYGPDGSPDGDATVDISTDGESLYSTYNGRRQSRYMPAWLAAVTSGVARWARGPQPPRPYAITPVLPAVQTAPLRYLDRFFPKRKQKVYLLVLHYALWLFSFVLLLRQSAFSTEVEGYGAPLTLSCEATLWGDNNSCGLDGNDCRPFDNKTFAFRCPANCERVEALVPHAVGALEVVYRPLVIGGPMVAEEGISTSIYRGDSFLCSSAVHSGFISNKEGGCGAVSLLGREHSYPAVSRHGIKSIGFDSYFPQSFTFLDGSQAQCRDLRWPLLAVSLFFTVTLSLFTTEPSVFFFSVFAGLFIHVGLVSDPPELADYHELVSLSVRRVLPSAFVAFVMYKYCIRRTLNNLEAQVEKTLLWLGGAWIGALNNYTFDKIPIQRLTPHDLQQPGAVPALISIVIILLLIALGQAHCLRVEGRMPRLLAFYALAVLGLVLLAIVPRMNLRIHHYILGLLLLPGTSLQTRPSLLYQGILVGLFINGIARWGYDSLLQTPAQLFAGDQMGTPLPQLLAPIIGAGAANITFFWEKIPSGWDGISVLVNDVERYRGYSDRGEADVFAWERQVPGLPEYFRFAYMAGNAVGDFTKAGILTAEGEWVHMEDGPSMATGEFGGAAGGGKRVIDINQQHGRSG